MKQSLRYLERLVSELHDSQDILLFETGLFLGSLASRLQETDEQPAAALRLLEDLFNGDDYPSKLVAECTDLKIGPYAKLNLLGHLYDLHQAFFPDESWPPPETLDPADFASFTLTDLALLREYEATWPRSFGEWQANLLAQTGQHLLAHIDAETELRKSGPSAKSLNQIKQALSLSYLLTISERARREGSIKLTRFEFVHVLSVKYDLLMWLSLDRSIDVT